MEFRILSGIYLFSSSCSNCNFPFSVVVLFRQRFATVSTLKLRSGNSTFVSCTSSSNAVPILMDQQARIGEVTRTTKETDVKVRINLDGTGICEINTGIPFLHHMLDAVLKAIVERKGITRFGDFTAPLDEALVHVVLDLSGRPFLAFDMDIPTERVGTFDTQLVDHFFQSLVNTSGMTLHIRKLSGQNSHHIIEACFKAFARALCKAVEYDMRRMGSVPSSKGVLLRA